MTAPDTLPPTEQVVLNGLTVRHLLAVNRRLGVGPGSASELAAAIGRSEPYVSRLLRGERHSYDRILDIARVLHVEDIGAITCRHSQGLAA